MPAEQRSAATGTAQQSERRQEIAREVAGVLLERGLGRVSLRSLAAAMGTNHRMLLYHFGSLDALLAAAFEQSRIRQLELVMSTLDPRTPVSRQVRDLWALLTNPAAEAAPQTFFEMFGRAVRERGELSLFAKKSVDDWINYITVQLKARGLEDDEAHAQATLILAVFRGLLMDLLATGDRSRVEAALEAFLTKTLDV